MEGSLQAHELVQETFRDQYRRGNLEDRKVTIDVPNRAQPLGQMDLAGFQQARHPSRRS